MGENAMEQTQLLASKGWEHLYAGAGILNSKILLSDLEVILDPYGTNLASHKQPLASGCNKNCLEDGRICWSEW